MAAENKSQDEEFAGFENLDETYDPADDALNDDIDDAEFQDVNDPALDDVFEEDPQEAAAKPKKKVNWFNIIVALVAVLGAGGLIVSKLAPQLLGGGSEPTEMQAPVLADAGTQATPEAAAQAALAPTPDAAAQPGMLDNPDAFAQLAQSAVPTPQADPKNAIPDPFAALNKAAPEAPATADVPMPAPITAAAPAPVAEAAPSVPATPVVPVEAAPSIPATTTPMAVASDTAANSALQGEVDQLSSRMDTIESKLDAALATKTQTVAAPADDARFEAIQNVLARLESRLDDLSKAPARVVERVRDVSVIDDTPAPVKKSVPKKAKAKKSTSGDSYDEAYKPNQATATPIGATGTATGNSNGWVLRGAQPGQAILGQVGGDIRQVSIGDTVPGIGQVTGIAPINGRWVVQGTQGRVSQ
ncbi:MAG TPA: hypothetical protein VIN59_07880 [Alphaproteobacteria bacterium]